MQGQIPDGEERTVRTRTRLAAVLLAAPLALTACADDGNVDVESPNVEVTPGDIEVTPPDVTVPDVEVTADVDVEPS